MSDTKKFMIEMPTALHIALKSEAPHHDQTMNEFTVTLLDEGVRREHDKREKLVQKPRGKVTK